MLVYVKWFWKGGVRVGSEIGMLYGGGVCVREWSSEKRDKWVGLRR